MSSVDILYQRLDDVRRRERAVMVAAGLFKTLLAVIVLLLIFFVLDWLIISRVADGGGDRLVRGVLALAMLATAAAVFWRAVGRVVMNRPDDDAIALRVESRHGALRGRLISTIQLTRSQGAGAWVGSEDLIKALEADTISFAQALDFRSIINRGTLKKAALVGGGLFVLAIGLGAWKSDFARVLFSRLFLGRTNYPTATRIAFVTPGSAVPHGEPFAIEVRLDPKGVLPKEAVVMTRSANGGGVRYVLARQGDSAIYRGSIDRVLESQEYRPVAGDARWQQWEQLTVLQRPGIKALAVSYRFPAYTGKEAMTSTVADIQAIEGTVVTLTATLSKPLAAGRLRLRLPVPPEPLAAGATPPAGPPVPLPVESIEQPLTVSADGLTATATITLSRDGWYALMLKDRDGLTNRDPSENVIDAVPDQAPTINLLFPGKDKMVTARAAWPLRFEARDDFGLAGGVVKYQVASVFAEEGKQVDSPIKEARIDLAAKAGTDRVMREVLFDLKPLALKADQRVTYWIEIADNRAPQPNQGRSRVYAFTVADDATVREALDRDRDDQMQRVEGLQLQQKDNRTGVDQIRSDLRTGGGTTTPGPVPPAQEKKP